MGGGPVSDQSEEFPIEIARPKLRGPIGFNPLLPIAPIVDPRTHVLFCIVAPGPNQHSIRRPERFLSTLAPVHVSNLMLLLSVFVIGCLCSLEQISPISARTSAPRDANPSLWISLGIILQGASGKFGCDISKVGIDPCLIEFIMQTGMCHRG